MKFLLTIWVCSILNGTCSEVPFEVYEYQRFHKSHYDCIQKGLGESYAILFDGNIFLKETVEGAGLYPRFSCRQMKETPSEST
mgnify:CR=1 FL=1